MIRASIMIGFGGFCKKLGVVRNRIPMRVSYKLFSAVVVSLTIWQNRRLRKRERVWP